MWTYEYNNYGLDKFFSFLKKKKVISASGISKSEIEKMSLKEIHSVACMFSDIAKTVTHPSKDMVGIAMASESISGARYPCMSLDCRLERLQKLKYSALTMFNTVYFQNPLQGYSLDEAYENCNEIVLKCNFFEDLSIVVSLQELLTLGMVLPYQYEEDICFDCRLRDIGGGVIPYDDVYKKIRNYFQNNTSVFLSCDEDGILDVSLRGKIYDHNEIIYQYEPDKVPEWLLKKTAKCLKLFGGEAVKLNKKEVEVLENIDEEVHYVMSRAVSQIVHKVNHRCDLVIDREIEHDVIKSFYGKADLKKEVLLSEQVFDLLPMLPQIPMADLIDLRLRENKAFQSHVLNLKKLKETFLGHANLEKKEKKQAYEDIILPELIKLQSKIDIKAKDRFARVLGDSFYVGAASFLFLAASFADPLKGLAGSAIAGGINIGKEYVKDRVGSKAFEDDDFYYMLKLSKIKR